MAIDIALALIFIVSLVTFLHRVSIKIPELIAIPDDVITLRLKEDSAKFRLFLLQFKTFYREGWHKIIFWKLIGRSLHRLHIMLLRLDNSINLVIKQIRERGIYVNGNGGNNLPENRIHEIKIKK